MAAYNIVSFCVLIACVICQDTGPIVDTIYGQLQGVSDEDLNGQPYDVFRGIPYGLPPEGELRFTKTQPPEPWEGVRPAVEWGDHCVHFGAEDYPATGLSNVTSEDCLFLNVFVPQSVDSAQSLPVMVWLHGGGYYMGTGARYPGELLAQAGPVVVVTINYRLGPIGFLSTEDDFAPGNYGLWDVQAALQWVQHNIENFGGDPDSVTTFGQSAGAGLTSHVMTSPACKGLTHRGIMLSGAASGFFGHNYPGRAADITTTLARAVGCRRLNGSEELVECLREVDADELDWWGYLAVITLEQQLPSFMPSIDGDFIPDFSKNLWEDGAADDMDIITGFTEHDTAGFVLVNLHGVNESTNLAATNATLRLAYSFTLNQYPETEDAVDAIYEQYDDLNSDDVLTRTIAAVHSSTDMVFASSSHQEAELHSVTSGGAKGTYHYNFNYRHSFLNFPEEWVEGSHYHDNYATFGESFNMAFRKLRLGPDYDFDDTDHEVSRIWMQYLTNFAYTGNPNEGPNEVHVLWPAYNVENREMLRLTDEPSVEAETEETLENYEFWNGEFQEIARPEVSASRGSSSSLLPEDAEELTTLALAVMNKMHDDDPEMLAQMLDTAQYMLQKRRKRLGQ